ncbi:MAG: hypothetical protein ACRCZI_12075 [Cetobacterium sp.]
MDLWIDYSLIIGCLTDDSMRTIELINDCDEKYIDIIKYQIVDEKLNKFIKNAHSINELELKKVQYVYNRLVEKIGFVPNYNDLEDTKLYLLSRWGYLAPDSIRGNLEYYLDILLE